ncbi:Cap-specific mRNA (nucleoside-2'-O-)-methyltransferase 1 [Portunus trituberculatus]|uniref:Cap-specific mRNA (Nucleoside-2'-O-)-methyltransferase 1 n=1 Tax=Portunus trituberculatus TaxID=210409 RepID=A0A5B7GE14_PORTR|nr:Cap-specific mRNA (nucleoside-2'-O-)-methyltransferase 1 [Portunus trituberculatus]
MGHHSPCGSFMPTIISSSSLPVSFSLKKPYGRNFEGARTGYKDKEMREIHVEIKEIKIMKALDVNKAQRPDGVHKYLKKFATAVSKTSRPDLAPIRCKELYKSEAVHEILQPPRLSHRMMKGGPVPRRVFVQVEANSDREAHYIVPTGILFLKATKGEVLHTMLSQCYLFHVCLSMQHHLHEETFLIHFSLHQQPQDCQ